MTTGTNPVTALAQPAGQWLMQRVQYATREHRARNVFKLSGTVPATGKLTIPMMKPKMPLNNDGDGVVLVDAAGVVRSRAAYTGFQARAGAWIEFGK